MYNQDNNSNDFRNVAIIQPLLSSHSLPQNYQRNYSSVVESTHNNNSSEYYPPLQYPTIPPPKHPLEIVVEEVHDCKELCRHVELMVAEHKKSSQLFEQYCKTLVQRQTAVTIVSWMFVVIMWLI